MGNAIKTFDKSNVNRGGDPENAGRFSDKPGSGSSDKDESSKTSSKQEKKPDSGTVQGSGNSSNKPQSGNLGADKPKESNPTMTSSSESFEKRATSLKGKHDKSHDAERSKLLADKLVSGHEPKSKPLDKVASDLNKTGGFTYDTKSGEAKTVGFMVSPYPQYEKRIRLQDVNDAQLAEELRNYVTEVGSILAEEGNHFGGWVNPDVILCLDVTKVVDTAEKAREIAIENNQEAFYDAQVGEDVIVNAGAVQERERQQEAA